MVANKTECALGNNACANVEISSISGAETQRSLREAVFGDMLVCGGKNIFLCDTEGTGGRRMVV